MKPSPPVRAATSRKRQPRRKTSPLKRRLDRWRERADRIGRVFGAVPPSVRTLVLVTVAGGLFLLANLVYHVIHKPTEMLYPASGVLKKSPRDTWKEYGPLFREYSTATISPELLAALAQTEGAGDPIAHTYWRWRLTWPPFEIYKPASSAVGMYQITDATFADAERYCIRNHMVIERGAAGAGGSCWSEDFYNRLLPNHAIELTSAHLDRSVAAILGRQAEGKASPQQKQELAALVHLCGAGAAKGFAHNGFRLTPGEHCGDHSAEAYVGQVNAMARQFLRLSAED